MKPTKIVSCCVMFLLVALLCSTTINAQDTTSTHSIPMIETEYNKIEFGVRILPTFSSFEMKTYSGISTSGAATKGYGVGLLIAYNFSKNLSLKLDLLYNSYSKKYLDGYLKREVNIHYINAPLLFALSSNKSLPVNFNVVFGPQIGINAGSNYSLTPSSEKDTLQGKFELKQFDFGLAYGAGLDLSFSQSQYMHVGIGFRGTYGLMNINNVSQTTTDRSYSILADGNINTYAGYLAMTFSF